jgi:thioredoxin 1
MKRILTLMGVIAFITMAFTFQNDVSDESTGEGIDFYQYGLDAALEKAFKEDKLVFVDIYATWCGPCKSLKATTFSDAEVGEYYNKTFVNIALNGEEGEGLEFAKKYQIKGYPTLLFLNYRGKVISSNIGFRDAEKFIELGKLAQHKNK